MTKESEQLTDTQQLAIIETAEAMIAEDFTSKPGWNWPTSSAKRLAVTIESPDDEGDIEIHVFIKRVSSDDDAD